MPTVLSHAVAAVALIAAFPKQVVPRRMMFLGAACSMAPDIDVLGLPLGIHYGDLLGHRGLSHSLAFASIFTALALFTTRLAPPARRGWVWLYLFLATASHGILDAFTDGGLGVAFLSPFDTSRYFFPYTPIAVSPIGGGFFSARGLSVLLCEIQWIWLPSFVFAAAALFIYRLLPNCSTPHNKKV